MIQIQLYQKELTRWLNALAKVETSAPVWIEDRIQNKMAIDYYQLLTKNILSGKYAGSWTYGKEYGPWKIKNRPGPFWKLTGDLMKSLTTWKDGKGYRSGIPAGKTGGMGWSLKGPHKRSIGMYGWYGEYGRKGQPARPLFKPTMDEYAASGHKKRGAEALKGIGRHWS